MKGAKATHWDTKSDVPWAHVPLCSVHPFRLKTSAEQKQEGRQAAPSRWQLPVLLRTCTSQAFNSNSVTLVRSPFLCSSLYTEREGEREGSGLLRNTQCSAIRCRSTLCTAANPTTAPWIFHSPSQELINIHTCTPSHRGDTHSHFGGRTNPQPLRYSGHKGRAEPQTKINRNRHTCELGIPRRRRKKGHIAVNSQRLQNASMPLTLTVLLLASRLDMPFNKR